MGDDRRLKHRVGARNLADDAIQYNMIEGNANSEIQSKPLIAVIDFHSPQKDIQNNGDIYVLLKHITHHLHQIKWSAYQDSDERRANNCSHDNTNDVIVRHLSEKG